MKVTGKDVLGAFLLTWAAGLSVGFTWLKLTWTTPLVVLVLVPATLGAFLLDPTDVLAWLKAIPGKISSPSLDVRDNRE